MKNVVLAIFVLVGLAVAGVAVFIATFDADRYRPLLIDKLQAALERPVELAHVRLSWQGGIAVQLEGLAVFDDQAKRHPLLEIDSVSALVRPLPLLRKQVEVSSIIFRKPRVRLARDAQGHVNSVGLAPIAPAVLPPAALGLPRPQGSVGLALSRSGTPVADPASGGVPGSVASGKVSSEGEMPVSFLVDALRIEDGIVHWRDASTAPPTALDATAVHVSITDIGPTGPMAIRASGSLAPPPSAPLAPPTSGSGQAGLLEWPPGARPQGSVGSEAPNVQLSGRLTLPGGGKPGALEQAELTLRGVPLAQWLPTAHPESPRLDGVLSLTLEGQVATLDPASAAAAASARGRLQLDQPRLMNLNVLRVVFERLSMLPGLVQRLESRLPPTYQDKLAANDTVLLPVDLPFQLERGVLRFDRFDVQTDTLRITGSGTVGLDRMVRINSTLRIDSVLSDAVIRSVSELRALTNASGELELPVSVQGAMPHVAVLPDVNYVASKVIATKAADVIGDLLRRRAPQPPAEGTEAEATSPSTGGLLGELLQRALQPDE